MAAPDASVSAGQDFAERGTEVSPVELFFDLVFVFAVAQLSQHLAARVSWRGAAETVVMLRAVFAVWFTTSWSATIVPAGQPRTRWLVLAVMLLGLFMNAAIPRAFTPSASSWAFVVPLLIVQLGRTVWTRINAPGAVFRDHYFRTLLWLIALAPLWLVGAAADSQHRLGWWALAAALDVTGAWLGHPIPGRRLQSENLEFDASHMLERCGLFLLIALGETVFTTGTAIADATVTVMTVITGALALWTIVALWALSYGQVRTLIQRHVEETNDPVSASRHAVNVLMVKVAGLIAVAVANRAIVAAPHDPTAPALALLLYGGPILFLLAQGWYLQRVLHASPRRHLASSAALGLLGCVALLVPAWAALLLAGVALSIVVLVQWRPSSVARRTRGTATLSST